MPDQCNICKRAECRQIESVLHILRSNESRRYDWTKFPNPCPNFVQPKILMRNGRGKVHIKQRRPHVSH